MFLLNCDVHSFITRIKRILLYFAKLICRNLYALFSHKLYTANQNGVQLLGSITNQRQSKCLSEPIRVVHRLRSNGFLDLAAFYRRYQIFLQKIVETKEKYNGFVSVGCFLKEFVQHQENKNILAKHREMFRCWKSFSFKERAERVGKYWYKRSRRVNRQF